MARKDQEFAASFPLDLGIDLVSHEASVQPFGEGGALLTSRNTRLNKIRGVPTKAPGTVEMIDPHTGSAACGGVIPCGQMSNAVLFRHRQYGPQRVAGTQIAPLQSVLQANVQNFWPADVSRAGAVPARAQWRDPAVCLFNGQMWFASVRIDTAGIAIFISVLGPNGELLVSPESNIAITGTLSSSVDPPWLGLTAHGARGVRLWYRDGTATTVKIAALSIVNGAVSIGTATSLYTPAGAGAQSYDLCKQDDDFAWLLTLSSGAVTSIALHKVSIATHTLTTTTTAVASATTSRLAVQYGNMFSGGRVAVAVSLLASDNNTFLLYNDSGVNQYTITAQAMYGDVAVGFWRVGGSEFAVFGVTDTNIFPSANGTGITLQFRAIAGGALANTKLVPWTRFVSRMVMHSPSASEMYPVFAGQPIWDGAGQHTAGTMPDPAIDVYRVDYVSQVSRAGRFGVDRAVIYAMTFAPPGDDIGIPYNGQTIAIDGNKLAMVYAEYAAESVGIYPTADPITRYVEMDFAARQPRYAIGADGSAIVASAIPVEWDGVSFSEICAPQRLVLSGSKTGGTAPFPPAGTYLAAACCVWTDASGVKHRGPPSRLISITMNGTTDSWTFDVTLPYVFRDGLSQDKFQLELYLSTAGGSILYRAKPNPPTFTSHYAQFTFVPSITVSANTPIIYTDGSGGQPVEAQQPGAFLTVAVVANRMWALNAERRNEWWFTKPKEDGFSYEWSSEFTISTPPAAGNGVAVVENGGTPYLLCERGVWAVTGTGPDVTNTFGGFNAPEQVSELGCSKRESVIQTPVGVMFIANSRFALVGAGGQRIFDQIDASIVGAVAPILLRNTQEVVWFSSTGTHYVYNYALDRWTTWDTQVCPATSCAALDPVSGLVTVVNTAGAVFQMDPNVPSTTAQMTFSTGRAQFGGPEDDNVINDVFIRARYAGPHGLVVTIVTDYGLTSYTTTFDAAQILACVDGAHYTLNVSPGTMDMRACRLTIDETNATGEGFQPVAVTFGGGKNGGPKRDAVRPAGRA